jgi:hypothetical protein
VSRNAGAISLGDYRSEKGTYRLGDLVSALGGETLPYGSDLFSGRGWFDAYHQSDLLSGLLGQRLLYFQTFIRMYASDPGR